MENYVSLKSTWDRQIKIGQDTGNHVTRKHEHDKLVDFILRREEGSLLVCGNRGVGKTSAVVKAINDADPKKNNIVVVKIDSTVESKSLTRELVASFYKTVSGIAEIRKEIKNEAAGLYANSEASRISAEKKSTRTMTAEKMLNIKINVLAMIALAAISILSLTTPNLIPQWIPLSITAIYAVTIPLLSLVYKRRSSRKETASYYYKYEYNAAKMQSSLMTILSKLTQYKILFVIDELDKTSNPQEKIVSLKTLINQGDALFIFISDPTILDKLKDKASKEYTLFSQKLFLKRPLFEEMDRFLDGIVCWNDGSSGDREKQLYKEFMSYISYVSHTDFFEIYNAIRDHTVATDHKKMPVLDITLDDEKRRNSTRQKAIRWVYEKRQLQNSSRWQDNDRMLESLYTMSEHLENCAINSSIRIDKNDFKFPSGDVLHHDDFTRRAVDDLYYYFMKCGYLRKIDDDNFVLTGDLRSIDPDKEGIFVAEWREFKNEFEKFIGIATRYGNICNVWLNEMGAIFESDTFNVKWPELASALSPIVDINGLVEHKNSFYSVEPGNLHVYQTEALQRMTDDVRSTNDLFVHNSYRLLAQIIGNRLKVDSSTHNALADSGLFGQTNSSKTLENAVIRFAKNDKTLLVALLINQPDSKTANQLMGCDFGYGLFIICVGSSSHPQEWNKTHKMRSAIKEIADGEHGNELPKKMYLVNTPLSESDISNVINALMSLKV